MLWVELFITNAMLNYQALESQNVSLMETGLLQV